MLLHRLVVLSVGLTLVVTAPPRLTVSAQGVASSPLRQVNATRVDDLRTWERYLVDGERSGSLRLRTSREDPDMPARRVERLDQYHNGVRIWGADVVRNSERGVPASIFGVVGPELTISTAARLTAAQAAAAMIRIAGADSSLLREPELLVLPLDSGEYRLAYEAIVSIPADNDVAHLFADANTGQELLRYTAIQRQSAVGTGRGVLGDQKKLSVFQQGGTYVASDSHRPPTMLTFDMRGNLNRFKEINRGAAGVSSSDIANDADNLWTDPAVVDAHAHVGMTYDYFYKRFGRNGLDDRNKPIYLYTNALSQQGALSASTDDYDDYVTNASWCGVCGPGGSGVMFFGNGFPAGVYNTARQNWTYTAGALDVVAHELTHAVTNSSSGLAYFNESGALNEAFSDIMGKSVEFYFHLAGSGVGQADYVLGKDVIRGSAGAPNGLRSMANPTSYGDPEHYFNRNWQLSSQNRPIDNGYVHSNSGIANHAFYLAIEGGTNRVSRQTVQGVGAANREQIEKVFYRAFTLLMPSYSSFVTARAATTQAAIDLYGAGSAVTRAVDQAWSAVGVPTSSAILVTERTLAARSGWAAAIQSARTGAFSANLMGNREDFDVYFTYSTYPCLAWPGLSSGGQLLLPPSCIIRSAVSSDEWEVLRMSIRAGDSIGVWVVNAGNTSQPFRLEMFSESVP